MKKSRRIPAGILGFLSLAVLFAGCGKATDRDTASLYLDEDGFLDQQIVEHQENGDDFTQEELEAYIEETIAAYTEQAAAEEASQAASDGTEDAAGSGDAEPQEEALIKLESCSMENGEIRIRLGYRSWREYAGYNQMPCFAGTVEEALAEGYTFEGSFLNQEGEPAGEEEIMKSPGDRKVLILQEATEVSVPGTILFCTDNVAITGKGTAVVGAEKTESEEAAVPEAVTGISGAEAEASGDSSSVTSADIVEEFLVLLDAPAYIIYM